MSSWNNNYIFSDYIHLIYPVFREFLMIATNRIATRDLVSRVPGTGDNVQNVPSPLQKPLRELQELYVESV